MPPAGRKTEISDDVLRKILTWRESESSFPTIAKRLNNRQVATPGGGAWYPQSVRQAAQAAERRGLTPMRSEDTDAIKVKTAAPKRRRLIRAALDDVMLGNNPNPTRKTAWTRKSQRAVDVATLSYGSGASWSLAAHFNDAKIGPGTVGWIDRADGAFGALAAVIAFTSSPLEEIEANGENQWYANGNIFPLPRDWWISGAVLRLAGWPTGQPPYGGMRHFQNGRQLTPDMVDLLRDHLHPVARDWVDLQRRKARTHP